MINDSKRITEKLGQCREKFTIVWILIFHTVVGSHIDSYILFFCLLFFLFLYSLFFGLRLSSLGVSGVLGFFGGSGVDNLIISDWGHIASFRFSRGVVIELEIYVQPLL